MMDQVCILDTETTALSPADGDCIELAVVRYSIRHRAVIEVRSWLLPADSNEAESINRIPAALLVDPYVYDYEAAWLQAAIITAECDAILAHNADFDRQWVYENWMRDYLEPPWIDTLHGVTWPMATRPNANLIQLALEHGIAVVDAHRALSDCLLLARLLTRCAELGYDVEAILARGLRPTATFQALVSYDDREKAKQAGFHWEAPKKQWLRKMAIEDATKLPFPAVEVKP